MGSRRELELVALRKRLEQGDPLWPAQLAVAAAIGLQLVWSDKLTLEPDWLVSATEGLLLVALIAIVPGRAHECSGRARQLALSVLALVSVSNIVSLAILIDNLINGGKAVGHQLILSGALLWTHQRPAVRGLVLGDGSWRTRRPTPRSQRPNRTFSFRKWKTPNSLRRAGAPVSSTTSTRR